MNVSEIFGENVFNDVVMRSSLPKEVYKSLRKTIDAGEPIDMSIADTVANAMKDWAVSKGATHYTHWFQPLTNLTAEKHDSFIEPCGGDGVIMQLTGKSLIVGEPDASSFPSGGSRATCAARGYTAWDPTSPAFVKEGTLYIPTVFVSYTGETLDKKAPLLKSMTALDRATKRILKLFGIDCRKVSTTVGPEQEYFLVDQEVYEKRKDLVLTGRTLFGAPAPRGQELEDHYFGVLKPRISEFMHDLDETLWKYGILAKTKHNEVAPAQHELAPVFNTTNIAVDNNQLTMEIMKKVAQRHGMACLLHEKPFEGINGSGKHNNWSLSTDTGLNLLDPGDHPEGNTLVHAGARLRDRGGGQVPGDPAGVRGFGGERSPSGRQRSASRDHLRVSGGSAGRIGGQPRAGQELCADGARKGLDRRARIPDFPHRFHRQKPHLPVCFHGKQIRVPHAGVFRVGGGSQHRAQYDRRGGILRGGG